MIKVSGWVIFFLVCLITDMVAAIADNYNHVIIFTLTLILIQQLYDLHLKDE